MLSEQPCDDMLQLSQCPPGGTEPGGAVGQLHRVPHGPEMQAGGTGGELHRLPHAEAGFASHHVPSGGESDGAVLSNPHDWNLLIVRRCTKNRPLTIAALHCFRAARVSKRYSETYARPAIAVAALALL